MATISHLLYASAELSLSDILRDLDIVTTVPCDDIEKIVDCDNDTINDSCCGIINEHNVKDIVVMLDKLQCTDAVTMLLNFDIVPNTDQNVVRTATINHSLDYEQLPNTYARTNLYNALHNHTHTIYPNNDTRNAITNGLCVANMEITHAVTDDDIKCCTSLTKVSIDRDTKITTLAPFAKTLRKLSIFSSQNTCLINDDALSLCTEIEELYISCNNIITTCTPFAKSLKKLCAIIHTNENYDTIDGCKNRGLTDAGLVLCTNIEILCATDNINITTCAPFAKSLKILFADGHCGITDDGLSSCTIIKRLHAQCNAKITTCVPFAQTLKILDITKYYIHDTTYGITDTGLSSCTKICDLNARDNKYITTCTPFAKSLKKLDASNYYTTDASIWCGISDVGLSSCSIICELNANDNPGITTCAPFAKSLKILHASELCGISDAGLSDCIAIEKLYATNNSKITTCNPFAKTLTTLDAFGNSGIADDGISKCTLITNLNASCNSKITTCNPFAKTLRKLKANNPYGYEYVNGGIGDDGLKMCNYIRELSANHNSKITTCDPFANTIHVLHASHSCGISNDGLRLCNSLTRIIIIGNEKIDKTYIETRNKNVAFI